MLLRSLFILTLGCTQTPEQSSEDAPEPSQVVAETSENEQQDQKLSVALYAYAANNSGQTEALRMTFYGENLWSTDVISEYQEQDASALFDWEITPALEGTLTITSENSLMLTPKESLQPNKTYTISVNKIYANKDKSFAYLPERKDLWTRSITVPPFKVAYSTLHQVDYKKNTATINIQLSHRIDPSILKKNVLLQVGNQQITKFELNEEKPGSYLLYLKNIGRLYGKEYSLTIASISYPLAPDQKSDPFSFTGTFENQKPITLYGPFVKETASGFTVEFVCDDSAVKKRRWHWDSEINFDERISERCSMDTTQLLNEMTFSPSVSNLSVYPREHGFAIVGNFEKGHYDISIPVGLGSQDGGSLTKPVATTINIPLRKPSLRFFAQGRYLPTAGWANVHYQHRNVKEITLLVREVPKDNLHNWLSDTQEKVAVSEGDLVLKKDVVLQSGIDKTERSVLDLATELPDRTPGLYEVLLKDKNSGTSAALRLQVTDISLIAKRVTDDKGHQRLWAWAVHSRTNKALSNTKLSLITPAGTVTSTCTTDSNGSCRFDVDKDNLRNPSYALYAERNGDDGQPELAYLTFSDLQIQLGIYDAEGASGSDQTYRIAAHSDRGAYRPGDTVNLFALIRTQQHSAPKDGLPVTLRIVDGRDQQVQQYNLQSNAAGAVTQSIVVPEYASTGSWTAIWEIDKTEGQSGTLGSNQYTFRVENLLPERMSVRTAFAKQEQLGGESLTGTIDARYLFGSPAAAANFSVRCEVLNEPFSPRQNSNYTYGSDEAFQNFYLGTVEGQLDEEGKGSFSCPEPERTSNLPGMARVVASIDVLEGGSGRSTRSKASVKVHPHRHYIGLQIGTDEIKNSVQYPISGITVDWDGKRISSISSVDVQNSQIDFSTNWYYDEETDEYRRESARFELPLQKRSIPVRDGFFQTSIVGEHRVASYRIRAESGQIKTLLDVAGEEYRWYYAEANESTPDPFRPDVLDLKVPSQANLQETITVTTTAPYTGRLLWTVERGDIIRQEWTDVTTPGELSWSFNLGGQPYQNNVYVSALLIKDPHSASQSAYMPSRAFGLESIPIRIDKFSHDLKISVPKEVQANNVLKVSLDFGGSVEEDTVAMVAVVDEGLLSLTNFPSPDPTKELFPKLPLDLQTFETIGWSIASPSLGDSTPAGGGAGQKRRAQVVKPVSLWSGIVDVPQSGKVDIPFDIPQYSGQVRVMVLTASPSRFAAETDRVFVRDPLTLQTTLPRFLTKGDQFQVPVFLTNLSGKKQSVTIEMGAKDGASNGKDPRSVIRFLGEDTTTVSIDPEEQIVVAFQAEAVAETGFAIFEVSATAGDLKSAETLEVPFSSQKPMETQVTKIHLAQLLNNDLTGTADISSAFAGWLTEDSSIWATNNPYSDTLVRVRDLIRYPYGCIEQTSSSLRPLLTAAKILQQVDPAALQNKSIDDMVAKGLDRLASMQTSDGGLAYWPGGSSPHPWGTAYATHVMLDAKDAGHPVMSAVLDNALEYLEKVISGSYDYGYYSYAMPTAKPYAHYLLARVGKGKPVAIRQLLETSSHPYESEYMLKTALFLSGDRTYAKELEDLANLNSKVDDQYDYWTFRSQLRSKGMILAQHQEMFGANNERGEVLANDINQSLLSYRNRYLSTQSLGWTTYALSKRVLNDNSWKAPEIEINGTTKAVASQNNMGSSWNVWDVEQDSDRVTVKGMGSDAYVMISSMGIRRTGSYQYGDSGLSISRTYKRPDGTAFSPSSQALGEEVIVIVDVTNQTSSDLHELALVDRIPAGWEINNPALNRGSDISMYYTGQEWGADYISMKDSQLHIFGDIKAKQSVQFVYSVRATTAGEFFIPPISIESMYNDKIWSRKAGTIIQIAGPWADHLL